MCGCLEGLFEQRVQNSEPECRRSKIVPYNLMSSFYINTTRKTHYKIWVEDKRISRRFTRIDTIAGHGYHQRTSEKNSIAKFPVLGILILLGAKYKPRAKMSSIENRNRAKEVSYNLGPHSEFEFAAFIDKHEACCISAAHVCPISVFPPLSTPSVVELWRKCI